MKELTSLNNNTAADESLCFSMMGPEVLHPLKGQGWVQKGDRLCWLFSVCFSPPHILIHTMPFTFCALGHWPLWIPLSRFFCPLASRSVWSKEGSHGVLEDGRRKRLEYVFPLSHLFFITDLTEALFYGYSFYQQFLFDGSILFSVSGSNIHYSCLLTSGVVMISLYCWSLGISPSFLLPLAFSISL